MIDSIWTLFGDVWGTSDGTCLEMCWGSRLDCVGNVWSTAGGTDLEMCGVEDVVVSS